MSLFYITKEVVRDLRRMRELSGTELREALEETFRPSTNLLHLWQYRVMLDRLSDDEHSDITRMGKAVNLILAGELNKAKEVLEQLPKDSAYRLYAEFVWIPFTRKEFWKMVNVIEKKGFMPIPHFSITSGRPSVVNGFRDFTPYFSILERKEKECVAAVETLYGHCGKEVYEVALAEKLYQENKCYEALVFAVGVLPFLREQKEIEILFAALFVQIEVMIMNGQIKSTVPMIEDIRKQVQIMGEDEWYPNIDALEAWAAMYDGDYVKVATWMQENAPDEYADFCMINIFRYMVKMRGYIIQEKYMALTALATRLLPLLEEGHHHMDVCEVRMLLAISDYLRGDEDSAMDNMEIVLRMAKRYHYYRLLADEGEMMYKILRTYEKKRESTKFVRFIISLCQKLITYYPRYLKVQLPEEPKLTDSELAVLRLMADGRSNANIAETLCVSLNTVKFHGKNIFTKLDVKNRHQAIAHAKELGIL